MQTNSSQVISFIIITTVLIFLLACFVISLLFLYQRKQLAYDKNLELLKLDHEKNLLRTQVEIQEQTFLHISREIHDNINLDLTLAKLNLNTMDWENEEKAKSTIKNSVSIISSVITNLSDLSKSMNTDQISNLGLINALDNEVNRLKNMAHLMVNFTITGEPVFMNSETELVLFRIIQEGFNNIIKHAKASLIALTFNYKDLELEIIIQDNGKGFDTDQFFQNPDGNRAGIKNMQTRTKLFSGNYSIESQPGSGTKIIISAPYQS